MYVKCQRVRRKRQAQGKSEAAFRFVSSSWHANHAGAATELRGRREWPTVPQLRRIAQARCEQKFRHNTCIVFGANQTHCSRTRSKRLPLAPYSHSIDSLHPTRPEVATLCASTCSRLLRSALRLHPHRTLAARPQKHSTHRTPGTRHRLHIHTPTTPYNVRAHPRKHPHIRRPTLAPPHQTPRPHTTRRPRLRSRSPVCETRQSALPPGLLLILIEECLCTAGNSRKCPGLQCWRWVRRVPRLQSLATSRIRAFESNGRRSAKGS